MAIRFYDDAVADKINSWLPKRKNAKIQVLKPEETKKLFTIEADQNNDKPISLPLIAISRDTTVSLLQKTMDPKTFDGLTLEANEKESLQLNAIPISLSYQLDIYTRRFDEGDELLREFLFKLINNPQLVVEFPYNNQKFKHISTLMLHDQVEDTSAISERLFSGQFTRWTIRFDVDNAFIFSLPWVDNVSIEDYDLEVGQNIDKPIKYEKE